MMTTNIERTEGHYEVQEVDFGRVYRWCPGCVNIECECGARLAFTVSSTAICPRCKATHAATIREELTAGSCQVKPFIHGATTPEISKTLVYLAESVDDGGH